uniref:Maturase-like protein 2 n=2 Tax=Euglena gracilis TaxID=3039 RepID=MAT2_EUGGR|nr:RecName: Full=Maturase-like protein 2 [Euglena gracilis]CAC69146.1 maturase [Euglena gracilis]
MYQSNLNLQKKVTSDLLYYSWLSLKCGWKYFFEIHNYCLFNSISRSWFKRTSSLIKKGFFIYPTVPLKIKNFFLSCTKKNFNLLKFKIVENAFLIIIKNFFIYKIYVQSMNLIECIFNVTSFSFMKPFFCKQCPNLLFSLTFFPFFKNDFLQKKKYFNSNKNFVKNFFSNEYFFSSSNSFFSIKFWDSQIKNFMTLKIIKLFDYVHKVRLKNIFSKFTYDSFFFVEIDKMFNLNLVNISSNLIYNSIENFGCSLLSSFFLNLYILEGDFFLDRFIFKICFKRNLFKTFFSFKKVSFFYQYSLKNFIPLRLEKNFFVSSFLKEVNSGKYHNIDIFYLFNNKVFTVYEKNIYYVRYLNFLIFGFLSSKNFIFFFKLKYLFFLRNKLYFNFREVQIFSSSNDKVIFLGVYIAYNKIYNFFEKLRVNKKYFLNVFQKIITKHNTFLKALKNIFHYSRCFNFFKKNCYPNFYKKKNFSFFNFYTESFRILKFFDAFFINTHHFFLPVELITSTKLVNFQKYTMYSFDFYNQKLSILLKDILENFNQFLSCSLVSIDLNLYNCLFEFKKHLVLLYNYYSPVYSFFSKRQRYKLNFNSFNYYSFSNFSGQNRSFFSSKANQFRFFKFFVPFKVFLKKLRLLGFIHPFKFRPIGNVRLLLFEDKFILRNFGFFVYSVLNWFSICENFSHLRFFVELIRESCFLTLCRKHNKMKLWSYSVYTFDLVFSKSVYRTISFFPTRKFIFNLKRKSFLVDVRFNLDETIFLE